MTVTVLPMVIDNTVMPLLDPVEVLKKGKLGFKKNIPGRRNREMSEHEDGNETRRTGERGYSLNAR